MRAFCQTQTRRRTPLSGPTRDLSAGVGSSQWETVADEETRSRAMEIMGAEMLRLGYVDGL